MSTHSDTITTDDLHFLIAMQTYADDSLVYCPDNNLVMIDSTPLSRGCISHDHALIHWCVMSQAWATRPNDGIHPDIMYWPSIEAVRWFFCNP